MSLSVSALFFESHREQLCSCRDQVRRVSQCEHFWSGARHGLPDLFFALPQRSGQPARLVLDLEVNPKAPAEVTTAIEPLSAAVTGNCTRVTGGRVRVGVTDCDP